jgi:hypothetical protein
MTSSLFRASDHAACLSSPTAPWPFRVRSDQSSPQGAGSGTGCPPSQPARQRRAGRHLSSSERGADCGVILVDPLVRHTSRMDPIRQTDLTRSLDLLLDASLASAVPVHIAFADTPRDGEEWASARPLPQAHVHSLGATGDSWSRSGLHEALAAQNRNSLIVGGFWLETMVTFLALQALASGFDVFVPMDAAPASSDLSARPAVDRLLQAGAVTVTTRQSNGPVRCGATKAHCTTAPGHRWLACVLGYHGTSLVPPVSG